MNHNQKLLCVCTSSNQKNQTEISVAKSLKTKPKYKKGIFFLVKLVRKIEDISSNIVRHNTHKNFKHSFFHLESTLTHKFKHTHKLLAKGEKG